MKSTEVQTLLAEARRAGAVLWVEANRLHYKAPTGGMSTSLLARLRSSREDVMAQLSQPVFKDRGRQTGLLQLPAYREDFWRETQANRSLAHATHAAVEITTDMPLERLYMAFEQVLAQHDLLRARIALPEGVLCLLFDQQADAQIEVADLSTDGSSKQLQRSRDIVAETVWAPFAAGSLFRACLLKVHGRKYVFGFVLHHLVCDLASCHILIRDFLEALHQPKATADSSPARPLQYSDYLLGTSEWLSGPAPRYRLAYWKEHMAGALPVCFPADHELGPASIAILDSISFNIDEPLRAGIARIATSSSVSMLAVMLTANFCALARMLQRADLVITPLVSGRDHPALFDLVGMTVDCLPVRATVLPEMTFSELLQQVHATYLLAWNHHVPWALVREALREIDVAGIYPLLNFVPGVYGARAGAGESPDRSDKVVAEGITVAGPPETTSVDWKSHELHVFDSGRVMFGKVKYMSIRYRKETIDAFIKALLHSLEAIVDDAGRRIKDISH